MDAPVHDAAVCPQADACPPDRLIQAMLVALRRHRVGPHAVTDTPADLEEVDRMTRFGGLALAARRCPVTKAYIGIDFDDLEQLGILQAMHVTGRERAEFEAMELVLMGAGETA